MLFHVKFTCNFFQRDIMSRFNLRSNRTLGKKLIQIKLGGGKVAMSKM